MPNYTPLAAVHGIVIHHSDSSRDATTFEEIKSWHLAQGWIDIGYHFVITGDGLMHLGRPETVMGAQTLNHNSDTLGICVTGDFTHEKPSDAQMHTLVQLIATLARRHHLTVDKIKGHRDFNDTSCPGDNLYHLIPSIRESVKKYL